MSTGANSLVQAVIPRVLTPIPGSSEAISLESFHHSYMTVLKSNAQLCDELTQQVPELTVCIPQGAMYAMIEIRLDGLQLENGEIFHDDSDFAQHLLREENLVLLPGQCFGMKNTVRIVTCPPREIIYEALTRLKSFITRHRVQTTQSTSILTNDE